MLFQEGHLTELEVTLSAVEDLRLHLVRLVLLGFGFFVRVNVPTMIFQFSGQPELRRALWAAVAEDHWSLNLASRCNISVGFLGMGLLEVLKQFLLIPEGRVTLDADEQLGDPLRILEAGTDRPLS